MQISVLRNPVSGDAASHWTTFLHEQPGGNFFQSPGMLSLYQGCRNYQPMAILAVDPAGEIAGVLVAVVISDRIYGIPFQRILIHGGPVVSGFLQERTAVLRSLLENLKDQVSRKTVFVEIRNLRPPGEDARVFKELGFKWHDHLNSILPVDSKKQVFDGMRPSKQRQVLRGMENGAVIRPAASVAEVNSLYLLLLDLYKKRVRKPLPPLAFFENFYRQVQQNGLGVILVVCFHDRVIGGMVCPFSGSHTVHEWYIASLRDALKNLYPGVLATWAGIEYAIGHNFSHFDFMGMGLPHTPYGTRDFKAQFGGEAINCGRWHLVHNRFRFYLGLLGYSLIKKLTRVQM